MAATPNKTETVDLLLPIGEATELPSGFGHLLFDIAVETLAGEQRRKDDPDAWELEPK